MSSPGQFERDCKLIPKPYLPDSKPSSSLIGTVLILTSWTTQTFLLTDTYGFSTLQIGLLGLLGLIGALLAPQWGRLVDRIVPWLGQLIGLSTGFCGMIIAFAGAEKSVACIAVSITLYDCGMQLWQVSSSYRIAGIDPKARARLNGCTLLCIFAGQVSGHRHCDTCIFLIIARHPVPPSSPSCIQRTDGV